MSLDIFKKFIAQEGLEFNTSLLHGNNDWKKNLGRLMAIAFVIAYKHPNIFEDNEMERYAQGVFDEMINADLLTEADVVNLLSEAVNLDSEDVPLGV